MHGSILPINFHRQSPGQVQPFGSQVGDFLKVILFRWQGVRRIENYIYLLLNQPTRGFFSLESGREPSLIQKQIPLGMRLSTSLSADVFFFLGIWCFVTGHGKKRLGPVPESPICANPGLKSCSVFVFYLSLYCLEKHFVLSLPYLGVKAEQYFESSSCMFLDKKTLIKNLA